MEEELRCPTCKQFFSNPVLLPCYHALCLGCAVNSQQQSSNNPHAVAGPSTTQNHHHAGAASTSSSSSDTASETAPGEQDCPDIDKLSILSETDSGVVCNSRPNSYVGTPNNMQGILLFPPLQSISALSLTCPVCHKVVYFDENGAHNLPRYRAMSNIVEKYTEGRRLQQQFTQRVPCQLCAEDPPRQAIVRCEQCDVWYCEPCREGCHPARGPLAKHTLIDVRGPPTKGPGGSPASHRPSPPPSEVSKCVEHPEESLNLYCMLCKLAACPQCVLQDSRHTSHDVQAISAMCKAQKTELSQNLQQLSEKAKCTTEFIHRLKGMTDKVSDNCTEFERVVEAQCAAIMAALEARKAQLLDFVRQERELRLRALREQVTLCTARLQHTTALLQFCIEALKETDSVTFLQVGSMLITRVANADLTWHKDVTGAPRVSHEFDLTLDDKAMLRAIEQLNFIQMKPAKEGEERQPAAPAAPTIIPEECSAENNSVTVAWQPPPTSYVEGYVLELDDGCGGDFREVYCGKETICTVDGLHFHSMYNARVRAFNSTGEGPYSECVGLQTAEVAWFTFEPSVAPPELRFSEDNATVTGEGYEHRVALGSVGFSRGVHYWEFSVDRYDADADPSFGVARIDVNREQMLGKDDKGWSMYIDRQRSWFMHGSVHEQRCEGGIAPGSTVGVLLDLERRQLSFYVNEEPQGPIAFRDLYGVFYPAVSVNRGVTVTLHTALDAPSDTEES